MYVVTRNYSGAGASELMDVLEQRQDEVREIISGVPGFVSYVMFRTNDGGTSVTICEDKSGTDESSSRAADWVKENHSAEVGSPSVSEGTAVLQF